MRKALVQKNTGLVLNTIVVDETSVWSIPEDCYLVDAEKVGGIGDTWDGRSFVSAPETEDKKKKKR